MSQSRRRLPDVRMGVVFVATALGASAVIDWLWGPIYGYFGWRALAIAILLLGVMAIAAIEEFLRPQNPYRHLDPRLGTLDARPSGQLSSSSSSLLWNAAPATLTIALLGLSFALD